MGRWLVTGASGLLGVNVVSEAVARGYATIACYGRRAVEIPGAECLPLTLTDPAAVEEVLINHKPAVVVHCAAETRVDYCEDYPSEAHRINVEGTRAVVSAAGKVGAKMVYISTDSVFDGQDGLYEEDHRPAPLNVYAQTKLEGEGVVRQGIRAHLIIRTNMFGWNVQPRLSLAEWFLNGLEKGHAMPGFTDVTFSPLLVNHLAEVIFQSVSNDLQGIFHVGSKNCMTKFDFGRYLCSAFGFDPQRIVPAVSSRAGLKAARPQNTSLSTSRIARALGRDMPMVQDGLLEFRQLRDLGYHARLRSALRIPS